ncbi:MAG: PASTA domain-containing protein [Desulfosarcina sp.]|nr:PASTA domain-containing protein [Desulfosarcina sp.]MBC2764424.1 PASTA domain-containing protein [Desulfosarcina sp.]
MPPSTSSVKRLARKTLRILLLVALFMAMAGIGAYVALTLIIKGEDTVVVPDLVGKDVLYGLEILSDLGLNTRVKGTAYHDQVPKNHVIDQDPDAGAAIKRGRDVKIRVSRGPETIVMPNLAGLSLQQSRVLLTENGLCRGTLAGMNSPRSAAGQVIAQSPPPGATVSRNTCADLLISRGPSVPAFPMVDLSGFTLESAIRRLEQLQLTVGTIRFVHRISAPLETIVDQLPLAGYRVARGGRVDLTFNRSKAGQYTGEPKNTDQVELFRFSLENGFLNKRVQVKINQAQFLLSLFDDFMAPGQEIWLLVPKSGNPTVLIYVDGQLMETRIMDGR